MIEIENQNLNICYIEPYFKHLAKEYNGKTNKMEKEYWNKTKRRKTEEKFWNKTNLISFYVQQIKNVLKEYKNKPFKKSLESIMNTYKVI